MRSQLIYASRDNRQQTVRQYGEILKFYQSINDRRGQAMALNNVGDFFLRLGESQKAWDSYKRALPLSQEAGDPGVLIATLYNLARADRDLGALDDALAYIKQSIEYYRGPSHEGHQSSVPHLIFCRSSPALRFVCRYFDAAGSPAAGAGLCG